MPVNINRDVEVPGTLTDAPWPLRIGQGRAMPLLVKGALWDSGEKAEDTAIAAADAARKKADDLAIMAVFYRLGVRSLLEWANTGAKKLVRVQLWKGGATESCDQRAKKATPP